MAKGENMTEFQLETDINEFIAQQRLDDGQLAECFIFCQTLIDEDEERVRRLYNKGGLFRRFADFVSGRTRKNKEILWGNQQAVQKTSLQIQRILAKKLVALYGTVENLNDKLNEHIIWTQRSMKRFLELSQDFRQKLDLTNWIVSVSNQRTEKDERYIDIPKERLLLYLVSDIFTITKGSCAISRPELETVLDNAKYGREETVSARDFFNDIISRKGENLWLFVKDESDYEAAELSPYGRFLYDMHRYFDTYVPNLPILAGWPDLEAPCRQYLDRRISEKEIEERISPYALADALLKDMAAAHEASLEAVSAYPEEEDAQEEEQGIGQPYCIIIPEWVKTMGDGEFNHVSLKPGKHYTISPEKENAGAIREAVKGAAAVVCPREGIPDVKKICGGMEAIKFLELPDY
ncbi:MAG: hypothetical protein IJU50_10195, partial [Lachnospiraceae bacterium]|nr:hypothetical protein [Lachnospiraceae bacterium]